MDTSPHTLNALFEQLGLPSDDDSIERFFSEHTLAPGVALTEAGYWSASQSAFLHEAIAEDSDWAEVVDQLDAGLRAA